eukprot:3783487-Rhodomonas_salina.1
MSVTWIRFSTAVTGKATIRSSKTRSRILGVSIGVTVIAVITCIVIACLASVMCRTTREGMGSGLRCARYGSGSDQSEARRRGVQAWARHLVRQRPSQR